MQGLLPIIKHHSGCDYHRVILPLIAMGVDLDSYKGFKVQDKIKETKVFFFNRTPSTEDPNELVKLRKQGDFKVVMDIDDYWVLNTQHTLKGTWNRYNFEKVLPQFLAMADAVTCTTSLLADKIRPINKNVHVIPNALPFGYEQFTDERIDYNGLLRFIYTGGNTHFWDLKELIRPFEKVANNPQFNKASFALCGYNDGNAPSKKDWDGMERTFNLNGRIKNYIRRYAYPLNVYMEHYTEADVSLVPLENNIFTSYKSNLKIIEAGCKNIPCIVSDVAPYSQEMNRNVLMYAKNAREWYEHLRYCVLNPTFVKEKGLELGAYVREHYNLYKVNEYRKQLFEHLSK